MFRSLTRISRNQSFRAPTNFQPLSSAFSCRHFGAHARARHVKTPALSEASYLEDPEVYKALFLIFTFLFF